MAEQESEKDLASHADKKEGILLRIGWSEFGPAVFADQVLALTYESMLHLGFYQIVPPLVLGATDEERRQALEAVGQRGTIDAKLVVHITLPLAKLTAIIDALTKQAVNCGLIPEAK
jgi:hypothetical protein